MAGKEGKRLSAKGVETELVPLTSTGDRSLGSTLASVGQFIHSIDNMLLSGEIDILVHSSKDVPVEVDERITNLPTSNGAATDLVLMRKTAGVPTLQDVLDTTSPTPLAAVLSRFDRGATLDGFRTTPILSSQSAT